MYHIGLIICDPNYLEHHGIKGQKWGTRRYQNPDGTLTEEGKIRYGREARQRLVQEVSDKYDRGEGYKSAQEYKELLKRSGSKKQISEITDDVDRRIGRRSAEAYEKANKLRGEIRDLDKKMFKNGKDKETINLKKSELRDLENLSEKLYQEDLTNVYAYIDNMPNKVEREIAMERFVWEHLIG